MEIWDLYDKDKRRLDRTAVRGEAIPGAAGGGEAQKAGATISSSTSGSKTVAGNISYLSVPQLAPPSPSNGSAPAAP